MFLWIEARRKHDLVLAELGERIAKLTERNGRQLDELQIAGFRRRINGLDEERRRRRPQRLSDDGAPSRVADRAV